MITDKTDHRVPISNTVLQERHIPGHCDLQCLQMMLPGDLNDLNDLAHVS